jgi:hypothetical protein
MDKKLLDAMEGRRSAAVVVSSPTPAVQSVIVVTATPAPTALPTASPVVVVREVIRIVTATPVPTAPPSPTPVVEYIRVPVEVVTIVTAVPSPTPVLPVNVLRLCLDVEGIKQIYIDGVGIVGHGCRDIGLLPGPGKQVIGIEVLR